MWRQGEGEYPVSTPRLFAGEWGNRKKQKIPSQWFKSKIGILPGALAL